MRFDRATKWPGQGKAVEYAQEKVKAAGPWLASHTAAAAPEFGRRPDPAAIPGFSPAGVPLQAGEPRGI
jgi:hypothetical protein